MWAELHLWAQRADLPSASGWLANFARRIPCGECRHHWSSFSRLTPPDCTSHSTLFAWTVSAHNAVSRRLGKPEMSIEDARVRWSQESTQPTVVRPASRAALNAPFPSANAGGSHTQAPGKRGFRLEVVNCRHAFKSERPLYVRCELGLFGGSPHTAICAECQRRSPLPLGVIPQQSIPVPATLVAKTALPPTSRPQSAGLSHQKVILRSHLSPGDVLMLTAAVRDLHLAYPGRFQTAVETSASELWDNNPLVVRERSSGDWRKIEMHYPLINQSNQRPLHFIHGYVQYLESQLGVRIPLTAFKGDIYLSEQEKLWTNQVRQEFGYTGKFWILIAGGKYDFTTKWWSPASYQRVVDHFAGRLQFVQCGQKGHWHPALKGVFNLVGKTSIRQFIRLMYHATGVVCPVTFAMHLAAAVPSPIPRLRPCVVIAGGREPPHWEAYPGHQFLHTLGALPCCATGGCWKSRCQTVGDGDSKDTQNLCERPVQVDTDLRIAQCMMMLQPEDVIRAVERAMTFSWGQS